MVAFFDQDVGFRVEVKASGPTAGTLNRKTLNPETQNHGQPSVEGLETRF